MGSIALTAPDSWGWAAGSSLYAGVVNGFNGPGAIVGYDQTSWYFGATVATPVTGLKVGASFDYLDVRSSDQDYGLDTGNSWAIAGYASYQATEKLSFHARGEYFQSQPDDGGTKILALTGTVQYDLWKNVISRLEVRWDHSCNGSDQFGGQPASIEDIIDDVPEAPDLGDVVGALGSALFTDPNDMDAVMVALNVIYKF
jgi:hypothetical protein